MPVPIKIELAEGIIVYCADFREILPHEVDAIGHIITDAPYEQITHDLMVEWRRTDGSRSIRPKLSFDGINDMRNDLCARAHMKCAGWLLSFCSVEGVAAWRDAMEANKLKYKGTTIWLKPDAPPKFNGQGPAHGYESIVGAWCGPGYSRWNGGGRRGVFTHLCNPSNRDGRHQTEKPISLMMELVSLFSNSAELICDPFMGSGSTGIACVKLGRKFIGVEKNREYFDIAVERIGKTLAQGDLFVEGPKPKQDKFQWKI